MTTFRRKYTQPNNLLLMLCGQSNMSGRETMINLPAQYKGKQEGAYNTYVWTPTSWQPLYAGLNVGDTAGQWGIPAVAPFLIKNALFQDVYVVESSEGGTDLANDWSATGANYLAFEADAQAAIATLGTSVTPVVIFGQGEADAISLTDANNYQTNLEGFVDRVRTNISPNCIVIIIGLHYSLPSGTYPYADTVRNAQIAVAGFNSPTRPNCYYIDTFRSEISADEVHKTGAGYILESEQIKELVTRIV